MYIIFPDPSFQLSCMKGCITARLSEVRPLLSIGKNVLVGPFLLLPFKQKGFIDLASPFKQAYWPIVILCQKDF